MEIIFLKENENEICRMNAGSENVFTAKAQKGRDDKRSGNAF